MESSTITFNKLKKLVPEILLHSARYKDVNVVFAEELANGRNGNLSIAKL